MSVKNTLLAERKLKMQEEKKKKLWNDNNGKVFILCIMVVMAVAAAFSFTAHMGIMDDLEYSHHGNISILGFVKHSYRTWTSRFLIEAVAAGTASHSLFWRVANVFVYMLIYLGFCKLLAIKSKEQYVFLAGTILLYTFGDMESAGWIATTTNYLWPGCAILISFLPLRKIYDGKSLCWYDWIPGIGACAYATNQEQSAAMFLLLALGFCVLFYAKEKKIPWIAIAEILVCVGNMIVIMICPGNAIRMQAETTMSPGYEKYNFFDKIIIGILRFFDQYLASLQPIVWCFAGVVLLAVFMQKESKSLTKISAFTLCLLQVVALIAEKCGVYHKNDSFQQIQYTSLQVWLPVMALLIWGACFGICTWQILRSNSFTKAWCFIVAVSSLATIVMLGLSATIYRSKVRTNLFCLFGFIYLVNIMYHQLQNNTTNVSKWKQIVFLCVLFAGAIATSIWNVYMTVTILF